MAFMKIAVKDTIFYLSKKRPTDIWKLSKAEKVRPQPNISTLNLAFFFSGKSTGDENKNMISDFVIFTKLN